MYYKEYTVSFYGKQFQHKPDGKETSLITSKLKPTILTYDFLADRVGNHGCTFAPAVFDGARKSENFMEQQLFAVDMDDGISYPTIKQRADRYHLPVLFAYKSFSWTGQHEKFRIVFAVDKPVTDAFSAQVIMKTLSTT